MHYAAQLAVWHFNPPPLPFCSLLSTSFLPPSSSQDLMTSNPFVFFAPQPSICNLSLKTLLSPPGSYLLHSRFTFSLHTILLPVTHPSNFPPIFPCSCSSRWKVCVLILLHHKKAPSTERDHPLSPICNSVFCLPLTLLASLSDPKSLSHLLSVSPSVSPYTPVVLLSNNCVFICLSSSAANWFNLLILEHNVSQQQTPTDFRILFSFITALLPQLLPCLK